MADFERNDRVKIKFENDIFIEAMVLGLDNQEYLCTALSSGGGYKQGDKLFCTEEQMIKTSLKYDIKDELYLINDRPKAVVFVGGDLMGVDTEGNRTPYSIDWLMANKTWAVRQLNNAMRLKNLARDGIDVIVFVAYKKLLGAMKSNPAFQSGLDRETNKRLNDKGLTYDDVLHKVFEDGLTKNQLDNRVRKYLGISQEEVAKELAMEDYRSYIGKIVGVAKFSGVESRQHRQIVHQVYPYNIILENYTNVVPPIDFEEFMKENNLNFDPSRDYVKLRAMNLKMDTKQNPAISYLYDLATYNDHYEM